MGGEGKDPVPGSGENAQPWKSIGEAMASIVEPTDLNADEQRRLTGAVESARIKFEKVAKESDTEAVAAAHREWYACTQEEERYIGGHRCLLPELRVALEFIFSRFVYSDHDKPHREDAESKWPPIGFRAFVVERGVNLQLFGNGSTGIPEEDAVFAFFCELHFVIGGHTHTTVFHGNTALELKYPFELNSWREGVVYAMQILERVCKRYALILARRQRAVSEFDKRIGDELRAMQVHELVKPKKPRKKK